MNSIVRGPLCFMYLKKSKSFLVLLMSVLCLLAACREDEKITESDIAELPDTSVYSDRPLTFEILRIEPTLIDSLIGDERIYGAVLKEVHDIYRKEDYGTLWFGPSGLTEQTQKMINLLTNYFSSGILDSTVLVPEITERYHQIRSGENDLSDTFIMESDVLFTAQFFLIASKAWKGIGPEKARQLEWFLPLKQTSLTEYLQKALSDTSAVAKVPVFMQYERMVNKLLHFEQIMRNGGFTVITKTDRFIAAGDTSLIIPSIRKRLNQEGAALNDSIGEIFDDLLAEAIVNSRVSYGLSDTALIDNKLIAALNIPVESRIRQMLINLERWKWIPQSLSDHYIVVNLPDYRLHVFENGRRIKSMRVIIGKEVNQTVIFSGNISQVVFSPYWTIPKSIIIKETLPAIRNNKNYLQANNMEVVSADGEVIDPSAINWSKYQTNFPYTIRQRPGPNNALGHVKFLFPNNYAIYLHDTPARHLFSMADRRYSHGCIRIEEPEWLADYLLSDQPEWNDENIRKAMHGKIETSVKTIHQTPVFITYFTSWVDSQGRLHFRDDIYGHDRKLERELFGD